MTTFFHRNRTLRPACAKETPHKLGFTLNKFKLTLNKFRFTLSNFHVFPIYSFPALCRRSGIVRRTRLKASAPAFALTALALTGTAETAAQQTDTTDDRIRTLGAAEVTAPAKETVEAGRMTAAVFRADSALLASAGVSSAGDLSTLAPGFYMPRYGSRLTSALYVRGIGARIGAPAVGMYVDGLPLSDKTAYDFGFLPDLEHIDVLSGPQGTLYGRGAMGGVVRVETADPLSSRGTRLMLEGSTRTGSRRAGATQFFRLSPRAAFSLSAGYEGADGFRRNVTTSRRADDENAGGARTRWAWRPSERLRLDFTATYDRSREAACPYYYAAGEDYREGLGLIAQNRPSAYRREMWLGGLTLTWRHTGLTLRSTTSGRWLRDRLDMDQDFLAADIFTLSQRQKLGGMSQELTLETRRTQRWRSVTGLFADWSGARTRCPVIFYADGMDYLNAQIAAGLPQSMPMSVRLGGDRLALDSELDTPGAGAAMFHQSTFRDLGLRGLDLTLGLRLDYEYHSLRLDAPAEAAYAFAMPSFGLETEDVADFRLAGRHSASTLRLLPKLALSYALPRRGGNIYASLSRGYRPGGYNIQSYSELSSSEMRRAVMLGVRDYARTSINAMPMPEAVRERALAAMEGAILSALPEESKPGALEYKAETTWNVETGTRLRFAFGHVRLETEASAYAARTTGRQLAEFAGSGYGRRLVNAGTSRQLGVDAQVRAALLDGHMAVRGAYGYVDARFTRYEGVDNNGGETVRKGVRVPFVPRHTLSLSADGRSRAGRSGTVLGAGLGLTGTGSVVWDAGDLGCRPFAAELSARLFAELPLAATGGTFVAEVWGRNLTGTCHDTFRFASMGHVFAERNLPARMGLTLRAAF